MKTSGKFIRFSKFMWDNNPAIIVIIILLLYEIYMFLAVFIFIDYTPDYTDEQLIVCNDELVFDDGVILCRFIPVEGGKMQKNVSHDSIVHYNIVTDDINDNYGNYNVHSFLIGEIPVTNALFDYVESDGRVRPKKDSEKAQEYASHSYSEWMSFIYDLSVKTGRRFRLPTSEEWEYAAKGGTKSQHFKYAGSNNIDEVASYSDNGDSTKVMVGKQKQCNELGIYDMSGGVWELTSTTAVEGEIQTSFFEYSSPINYEKPVLRGGDWNSPAEQCAVDYPGKKLPTTEYRMGLRLILEY